MFLPRGMPSFGDLVKPDELAAIRQYVPSRRAALLAGKLSRTHPLRARLEGAPRPVRRADRARGRRGGRRGRGARRGGARLPRRAEALRRRDRAQDRARPGAPRPRATRPPCARAAAELLATARPEDGAGRAARRRAGARAARADRGPRARSAASARACCSALGGILAEALRRRRVRGGAASTRARRARLIGAPRARAHLLEPVPRRAARSTARRSPTCSSASAALARRAARRRERRPEPADRARTARPVAVDALVELGEPAAAAALRAARGATPRCSRALRPLFHPRGIIVAGVVEPPGQVRLRRAPQPAAASATAGELFAREPRRRRGARPADAPRRRRGAGRRAPTWSSSARRTRRTSSCCARARSAACAPRSSRAAATARPGDEGRALEARARRDGRRARHGARGPERPGRDLDRRVDVRADRGAVPAARAGSRVASQSGNLVSSLPQLRVPDRASASRKAVSCRQLGADRRIADYLEYFAADPETAVALAYLEGVRRRRAPSSTRCARVDRARSRSCSLKGGVGGRGPARGGEPHRLARQRRPRLRRHLPPGRGAARADGRGGVRVGRDASRRSRCRAAGAWSCSRPPAAGACSPPTPAPPPGSS